MTQGEPAMYETKTTLARELRVHYPPGRGRIALRSEDAFGAFVALGLTAMICAQALFNMSVVLSLLPTKGIPLPLLSAGGSSLLASLIGIGVLLNISQHATAEA